MNFNYIHFFYVGHFALKNNVEYVKSNLSNIPGCILNSFEFKISPASSITDV